MDCGRLVTVDLYFLFPDLFVAFIAWMLDAKRGIRLVKDTSSALVKGSLEISGGPPTDPGKPGKYLWEWLSFLTYSIAFYVSDTRFIVCVVRNMWVCSDTDSMVCCHCTAGFRRSAFIAQSYCLRLHIWQYEVLLSAVWDNLPVCHMSQDVELT